MRHSIIKTKPAPKQRQRAQGFERRLARLEQIVFRGRLNADLAALGNLQRKRAG